MNKLMLDSGIKPNKPTIPRRAQQDPLEPKHSELRPLLAAMARDGSSVDVHRH